MLLQQLAHSAVGGFGASFGRDLYKGAKKNPALIVAVGALLLAFGWRNLFLGGGRSALYKIFVTGLGSLLMIVSGGVMLGLGGIYAASILAGDGQQPNVLVPVALVGIVSLIGVVWGHRDASANAMSAKIEAKNIQFLERAGLKDSGLESDTLMDADGNLLKVREQSDDRIVFSVANRRSLRAAINLNRGEMISYTGIIKV